MSKIKAEHIFTSESVSEGHPDKVCDQISDAIVDACLMQDPESRVACEVLTTTNLVVISGEITTTAKVNWQEVALNVVRDIGYNDSSVGFCADEAKVMVCINKQSPDISQGVTASQSQYAEQGAGDQGMMFGFACNDTEDYMPAPIYYAHKIIEELTKARKEEADKYPFLRPDAKSQVSIQYKDGKAVALDTVVVSHQHSPAMKLEQLTELVKKIVNKVIPANLLNDNIKYYINPTGRFEIGGPHGDTGLTGRKLIVDTYGGIGSHGGGAFSGKDPSKVDRSAAYMCRHIAKNIVAAKLADKCEIQVAYAIGVPEPLSINVDTYGTGKIDDDKKLETVIREVYSLKPADIIKFLNLKHPGKGWTYRETANNGHFGRSQFPWEKLDKVDELIAVAKKHNFI